MDVSLLLPSIRTHKLRDFYFSAAAACKLHEWEIVVVSPFPIPENLEGLKNLKWLVDYGNPTRCTQLGARLCEGEYIYNCVDDGYFSDGCIDQGLKQIKELGPKDIVNMRYRESECGNGPPMPLLYWNAHRAGLGYPGVHPGWKIALHFLMKTSYYKALGGVDCQFEYMNHASHDLMFRAQHDGAGIFNSHCEGLVCTHFPNTTKDHAPIHHAQLDHDEPLFRKMYFDPGCPANRVNIDFDNWRSSDAVWHRRFPHGRVDSYKELNHG